MTRYLLLATATAMLFLSRSALGVDVAGDIENPNKQYGADVSYRLTGNTSFGWLLGKLTGDLDVNGHKFIMETGGGNRTVFSGVIGGTGNFDWNGGGTAQMQTYPSFLAGTKPNTFSGTLTIVRGTLALAKPAGVDAVAAEQLVLGGGINQAIVQLNAAEQIRDSCNIRIAGSHPGRIWTQGNSETVGTLQLQSFGYIDLGQGASRLRFADSSKVQWDLEKTLTIQNWQLDKTDVSFGENEAGLTTSQLMRIGFVDPTGLPAGLYSPEMLKDGRVVPNRIVEATNPPFDVSQQAKARRAEIYQIAGRSKLSELGTPLKTGTRICFFGDSITWQNNYIKEIEKSLKAGAGTKNLDITLVNRGINGGGVLSIRDGTEKAAYVNEKDRDGKQAPFAEVIAVDKPDVAVVFIGVNDVWWRKTSPVEFEQALRDLAVAAQKMDVAIVFATLSVYQEKPNGTNPLDQKCEQFAKITRHVAHSTGATLVDLRQIYLAYLKNHNAELRVDGSLNYQAMGVLTYDGVHPNATGNGLLADHIGLGIYNSLTKAASR